jgi:hypothetical protein
MNNCIYCGETGAVTVTSDYVCTGVKCRANYMMNPHNNAVTKSYRENAMEF